MNVQALYQSISAVPGSFGDHISRRIAINRIAAGSVNHAAALVGLVGVDAIPALVAAGAPAAMLQAAINSAILFHYRELPELIANVGGRTTFGNWCRLAGFERPETLPAVVDIYRGTIGVAPAVAATGLHWSLKFDDAAFYAARYADTDLTGVHVIHARVPAEGIAAFVSGTAHQEVVPAEVPTVFAVITDKDRIGDAAVRNALRLQGLTAQGWSCTDTHGTAERVALAVRNRMAAAGVARGTAIVA